MYDVKLSHPESLFAAAVVIPGSICRDRPGRPGLGSGPHDPGLAVPLGTRRFAEEWPLSVPTAATLRRGHACAGRPASGAGCRLGAADPTRPARGALTCTQATRTLAVTGP